MSGAIASFTRGVLRLTAYLSTIACRYMTASADDFPKLCDFVDGKHKKHLFIATHMTESGDLAGFVLTKTYNIPPHHVRPIEEAHSLVKDLLKSAASCIPVPIAIPSLTTIIGAITSFTRGVLRPAVYPPAVCMNASFDNFPKLCEFVNNGKRKNSLLVATKISGWVYIEDGKTGWGHWKPTYNIPPHHVRPMEK